ncbi:MAG TPA: type II toxin-antitoxin system antitoxin SocA domain-containing protein, partial [Gemmataceae bacterium]|nr:type II toxin-antitoxin system antitoxin SocA domain-containing protein [Gemmataceae bacterium]
MATAMDVARYLLQLAGRGDEPELMTQKRLYKLLYYVQGWTLAWYGRPMFADRIEAWREGPVPPDLYSQFKLF